MISGAAGALRPSADAIAAIRRFIYRSLTTSVRPITTKVAAADEKQSRLDETLDSLRRRYGRRVIYYGNVHDSRHTAPLRISFTHIPDVEVEG